MGSKKPQMAALDGLISNFEKKLTDLKEEQTKLAENADEQHSLSDFIASSPTATYKQIEDTLSSALELLETAKIFAASAPDAETYSSVASMISSIQGLFGEFTDIWKKQINFQNAMQMENLKAQNKLELENHKHKLKLDYFKKTQKKTDEEEVDEIPFNTLDFVNNVAKLNGVTIVDAEID